MRAIRMFAFLFAVAPVIAQAQTKVLPATKIPAADIQERMRPRKAGELPNMRVLDSGGHNVGIGVLHRTQDQKQNTAVHFKVSEVYHIMKGSGTLVTGGTVVVLPAFEPTTMNLLLSGVRRTSTMPGVPSEYCLMSPAGIVFVSPTVMVQESGFSCPVIMRNSVVLPAPLGPMTPTMPPAGSLKVRSSIRRLSP